MKVTGIIAEFNPFHNGHDYLLQKAREITGAGLVVVVLSGNFVQRGAPALFSKYARAEAALRCGADLVVELPVFAACASAEYFAEGALRLLSDLGADAFVFGSEAGNLDGLLALCALLSEEPPEYRRMLKAALARGKSFPAARKEAAAAVLPEQAALLDAPNNLLGIEYLKACKKHGHTIKPYTVLRQGAGYGDEKLPAERMYAAPDFSGAGSPAFFPSAAALRAFLEREPADLSPLMPFIPAAAHPIFAREFTRRAFVTEADLSTLLCWRLLQCESAGELLSFADVNPALASRIFAKRHEGISLPDFSMRLKTKEFTLTRIRRALLHIILGITAQEQEEFRALPRSPYARILGMRPAAGALLRSFKPKKQTNSAADAASETSLPIIQKPARADKLLLPQAYRFFQKDIACAELYRQLCFQKSGAASASEFTHEIILCE